MTTSTSSARISGDLTDPGRGASTRPAQNGAECTSPQACRCYVEKVEKWESA